MPPTTEEVNDFIADSFPSAYDETMRCEEVGEGYAVARWTYNEAELRPGKYISGPRIFGLADIAFWIATFTVNGLEAMAVTSEMSIRFLRPAQYGDLLARADIDSVTRRRIVATVKLWIDGSPDNLVAIAQGSYARP